MQTVDVVEAIKGRRSVRAFRNEDVSEEAVARLIDAAHWAPSAGNIQPWEFIIVRKTELKRRLVEAAFGQSFVEEAPVVIVVCAREDLSSKRYGLRGRALYCLQDTAAAVQNIHLTAFSFGLGTCWIGAFREDDVREALGVPREARPVALIPVGYPVGVSSAPKRRSAGEITHRESF